MLSKLAIAWRRASFPWRPSLYVGSDLDGNEYYETKNVVNDRHRRLVVLKDNEIVSDYTGKEIPVQWQSWLRHTRYDSPTLEELEMANKQRELVIERAKDLDKEWSKRKLELAQQKEVPLIDKPEPKVSFPQLQDFRPPMIPSDDYEPEEWKPTSKKS
ncbi:hypothetical protein G9A89_006840 [Geosiphon pyriformis]|nr:hypothetical protein G9A89_006840 [Geosiphon pyriformis]